MCNSYLLKLRFVNAYALKLSTVIKPVPKQNFQHCKCILVWVTTTKLRCFCKSQWDSWHRIKKYQRRARSKKNMRDIRIALQPWSLHSTVRLFLFSLIKPVSHIKHLRQSIHLFFVSSLRHSRSKKISQRQHQLRQEVLCRYFWLQVMDVANHDSASTVFTIRSQQNLTLSLSCLSRFDRAERSGTGVR